MPEKTNPADQEVVVPPESDPQTAESVPETKEQLPPVNAKAAVSIAKDRMTAQIILTEPENGGKALGYDELMDALNQQKVICGLDEAALRHLSIEPAYGIAVVVAKGRDPVPGVAASLHYQIRLEKDIRPKVREDGSVDYKDLGIVQVVRTGDVLCTKTPATPGVPGENVIGWVLPAKPGKDIPLPAGKGTAVSEDKLALLASTDGQADMVNHRIQVMNLFTVEGDVGHGTGNISFLGNVTVNGNIRTGFSVQATGNVTVEGSVDDATVAAGGNIVIKQGINGSSKGVVQCGGYLKTKYIQSGTVKATGDIETTFILHSNVTCGGSIKLSGNGVIAGGRITARTSITTHVAGSKSSPVPTTLEVGNDPDVLARYREIPKEIQAAKKNLEALENTINVLSQLYQAGRLVPEKVEQYHAAVKMQENLILRTAQLEEEMEEVSEAVVSFGYGNVHITGVAYPSVRIVIGAENMLLEGNFERCTFTRTDKGVEFVPLRGSV